MSCEQVDSHMIDFLYGELPAGERAAFDAHVAGCERCRREVASFGRTRAVARVVLDEAPPPHLRARILQAASEARTATVVAPVKVAPARASLWDRLRGYWALPTLATVGALAVFLVGSRLSLNSQQTVTRGRELASPSDPHVAVHLNAPAPAPPAPSAASRNRSAEEGARIAKAMEERSVPTSSSEERARVVAAAKAGTARAASAHHYAFSGAPPAPEASLDEGGGGLARSDRGGAAAGSAAREKAREGASRLFDPNDSALGGAATSGAIAPAPAPARKRSHESAAPAAEPPAESFGAADEARRSGPSGGFAAAPPKAPAPPPPAAPEMVPPAPSAPVAPSADRRQIVEESTAPRVSASRARAERKGNAKSERAAEAEADKAEPRKADVDKKAVPKPAAVFAAQPASKGGAQPEAPRAESLVQRADRLFTEGRWVEAAVAYRDLLRQQPDAPDADRWRRRLAAAKAAAATDRRATP